MEKEAVTYSRILETCMGALMSGVLNLSAMLLLRAPISFQSVLTGWSTAFAVAVAINYLFPVMQWCSTATGKIKGKTPNYIVRVFLFAVMEILLNSFWCLASTGNLSMWLKLIMPLEAIGIPVIFAGLPVFSKVAAFFANT